MNNKDYILNIENPCQENWSGMQPQNGGRFCMQCSEKVMDFTKLNDTEIAQIIERSKGKVCGRMLVSQLNRPIKIHSKPKNRPKLYKALTAIFVIGSTSSIFATPIFSKGTSLNILKNESNSNYKRIDLKNKTSTDSLKNIIKGQVLTEFEDPIPEAYILIEELNLEIETDLEGYFSIPLPENFKDDSIKVLIKYLGFHDLETRIYKNELFSEKKFNLKGMEQHEINELVVIMGRVQPKCVETKYIKPKWWQFWKRL